MSNRISNNYDRYEIPELRLEIENRNFIDGLDLPNPDGKDKKRYIQILSSNDKVNKRQPFESVAGGNSEYIDVKLDNIETNPFNTRLSHDYNDPDLMDRILQSGIIKDPVVIEAYQVDPSVSRGIYWPIAGNRTVAALKSLLADEEIDFDTIRVKIKTYDDRATPSQIKVQMIKDLRNDNNSALGKSPWEQSLSIKHMIESGVQLSTIASDEGVSPGRISHLKKLQLLPERIGLLIHSEYHKAFYSKKEKDELIDAGIEFVEDEEGNVEILGISWSVARELCSIYPKRPAKKHFESIKAWQEELEFWETDTCRLINEFLVQDPIISILASNTKKAVQSVRTLLIENGLIDDPKANKKKNVDDNFLPESTPSIADEAMQQDMLSTLAVNEDEVQEPEQIGEEDSYEESAPVVNLDLVSEEDQAKRQVLMATLMKDPKEFSSQLKTGFVTVVPDFAATLAAMIEAGNPRALQAMALFVGSGLVERKSND